MSSFYEYVGIISLLLVFVWLISKLIKGVWSNWLANWFGLGVQWNASPNCWAIITGSTDGIGLAYAHQMAKRGYNLLLISRNSDKLNKTKDDILEKYQKCTNIKTLTADFTKSDIYETIENEVNQLEDIDVLINNIGISYTYPEYFTQVADSSDFIESIINANIKSCTKLMQFVLPKMETRRRGIIINVSSYSATYPMPLLSLYAATKIYVDYLSQALNLEYANKGIVIQSVLPAFVSTNMSKIRKTSLLVPSPKDYVESALKTVGVESRTYGYWSHKLQGFVQDCLISNIIGPQFNVKLAFDSLKDMRRRYYRKQGLKEKSN